MNAWSVRVLGKFLRAGAAVAAAGLVVMIAAPCIARAVDAADPAQEVYRQVVAADADLRAVSEQIRVRTAAGAPQAEVAALVERRGELVLRLSALLKAFETMEVQGAGARSEPPPGAKVPPSFLKPPTPDSAEPASLLNPPAARPPVGPPPGAKVPPSFLGPSSPPQPPIDTALPAETVQPYVPPPPPTLPASTSTWPPRRPVSSAPDVQPAAQAQPSPQSASLPSSAFQPSQPQMPVRPADRTASAAASPEERAMQDAYATYVDLVRRRAPADQIRAAFVKYREAQMLVTARDPTPGLAAGVARSVPEPADRARPAARMEERGADMHRTVGRTTAVAEERVVDLHREVGRAATTTASTDADPAIRAAAPHSRSGTLGATIDISGYPEAVRKAIQTGGARVQSDGRVVMSETKNSAGEAVESVVYDPATRSMSVANYNVASEPRLRARVADADLRAGIEQKRIDLPDRAYNKCAFCEKPAVSTKPGAVPCCTEHYYKPQKMEGGTRERMRCAVCGRPGDWLQQWGDTLCDEHYRDRDSRGQTAEAFGRQNLTCAWCSRPAMCFKPASGKPACDIHFQIHEPVDGVQAGIKCALCGKAATRIAQDRTGYCQSCTDEMATLTSGGRGEPAALDRPAPAQGADAMVNPGPGIAEEVPGVKGVVGPGDKMTMDAGPAANAVAPLPRPVLGPGNLPPGVNGGHFPPPGRPGVATLRTADGQTVNVPVDAEGRILGPVLIPQAGGAPPISWPSGPLAPDMPNSLLGMEAGAPTGGPDAIKTMSDPGTPSLAALSRGLEEQANDRSTALVAGGKLAWDERTMVENARNVVRESELRNERIKQDARAELQNTLAANARSRQTNTLAATLGNSVLDGVTTGVKNLGDTFGKHAADHVVDKLKLDKEEKPDPAASDGTSSTGATPGGWATSTPVGGKGTHGGKGAENCPDGHGGMAPAQSGGPVVTVEGYDMTCNKCGFKMRILEGQPVPAACPQCGASGGTPPPSAGDGMFDAICTKCGTKYGGPISQMNQGCPKCGTGGGGTQAPDGVFDAFCPICNKKYGGKLSEASKGCPTCGSLGGGSSGLTRCVLCGKMYKDTFVGQPGMAYKRLLACPECSRKSSAGPVSMGLFDAFCPIHRIKYGGEIGKVKGCPECLAEEAVKKKPEQAPYSRRDSAPASGSGKAVRFVYRCTTGGCAKQGGTWSFTAASTGDIGGKDKCGSCGRTGMPVSTEVINR